MENDPTFLDLTTLFLALQQELEAAGVGRATSLETQLREFESDLIDIFDNPAHLINDELQREDRRFAGTNTLSTPSKTSSVTRASTAAGIAP